MGTLREGLKVGLLTTWQLGKVIFPITLLVVILQHTPILPWVTTLVEPIMGWFGLRGEAAIPLILGNFLNLYAGIAGILSLELTVKEVFILAVMMSFAHNLLIETGVAAKVGVKIWLILAVRVGLAAVSALMIHWFWPGGQEIAQYGLTPEVVAEPDGWLAIFEMGLQKAFFGVFQLALIVIPLMIAIQILRDYHFLEKLSRAMKPLTRFLGVELNASLTLAAGLAFGLAYGAGVMIQAVEEDGVSYRDLTISFIFLVACHAVVEDTLLFVPLGINVLPLLLIRIFVALLLAFLVSRLWKEKPTLQKGIEMNGN